MARITVEDCLKRENNRFALILLAAKRTKQLLKGAKPLISEVKNKPVVNALREIAAGRVRFMTEEEAAEYREREREAAAEQEVLEVRPSHLAALDEQMTRDVFGAPESAEEKELSDGEDEADEEGGDDDEDEDEDFAGEEGE